MEKTWDDFWATGKVTDYLEYKNSVSENTEQKREQSSDVTDGCTYRHGTNSDAYR